MNLTKQDLEDFFKAMQKHDKERMHFEREKQKRIKDNFKALNEKAKELNKPIPDELAVVIWLDNPIGMSFYERHKEWLE
jgi:hypothetical protein